MDCKQVNIVWWRTEYKRINCIYIPELWANYALSFFMNFYCTMFEYKPLVISNVDLLRFIHWRKLMYDREKIKISNVTLLEFFWVLRVYFWENPYLLVRSQELVPRLGIKFLITCIKIKAIYQLFMSSYVSWHYLSLSITNSISSTNCKINIIPNQLWYQIWKTEVKRTVKLLSTNN